MRGRVSLRVAVSRKNHKYVRFINLKRIRRCLMTSSHKVKVLTV
jgi:hypothetical protein